MTAFDATEHPMTLRFSWRLEATANEAGASGAWPAGHWIQIAQAVEYAGLDDLYLPEGPWLANSLVLAALLSAHTRRVGLNLAIPPEAMLPAALATTLQSLQSLSNGRAGLHLPDRDRAGFAYAFGELLNRDQRHQRLAEFVDILRTLLQPSGAPFDHCGRYFQLESAGLELRALSPPPLMLDESLGAERIAAQADVCLLQGSTPAELGRRLATLRDATKHQGRQVEFACRFGVISRDSERQAWDEAAGRIAAREPARVDDRGVLPLLTAQAEHPARRCEIYPSIWRPDVTEPAVLVGSHAQVASRLRELHGYGLDQIILQAEGGVRDVLNFGERVLPLLLSTQES